MVKIVSKDSVSIKPRGLSPMLACDPGAYFGPGVFGPVWPVTLDRADELEGGFVQEPLPLGRAHVQVAGDLLQLALEARGEPDAVDLGLHASIVRHRPFERPILAPREVPEPPLDTVLPCAIVCPVKSLARRNLLPG